MGGYSGGPVFDLGISVYGAMTSTKEHTVLKGIVHGTMSDDSGGKLALITPTFYLADFNFSALWPPNMETHDVNNNSPSEDS